MNKKIDKSKISTVLILFVLFFVILFICNLFVNTHDDIQTIGTPSIKEAFDYSINYGNGRYLGNLIVTVLCNRMMINNLVRACSILFLICVIPALFDRFKSTDILLSAVLVLGILTSFFGSVYVWSHGFYNYVPPVVLLLLSVYILKYINKNEVSKTMNAFLAFALILLGVFQQLFSENTTVVNCIVAFVIFALSIKYNKCRFACSAFFVSALCGGALMYLGPKIMGIGNKLDFYRGSIFDDDFIGHLTENFAVITSSTYKMIVLIIAYFILFSLNIFSNKSNAFKKSKLLVIASLIILPVLVGMMSLLSLNCDKPFSLIIASAGIILYLIYFLLLLLCVNKLFSKKTFTVFATLMVIALLSVGELVIVYPVRIRCLYITYILLCIAFFSLLKEGLMYFNEASKKLCKLLAYTSLVAIIALLIVTYIPIKQANDARLDYIDEQMSQHKTTIEMVELPNDNWLVDANDTNLNAIVYNYGNPEEMDFVYITYNEYLSKTNIDTE